MLVPVSPDHPFAGIYVKLQRADENIVNLRNEIARFFQECEYPILPDPNHERWKDALNYHRDLRIPQRFSVLAGEIFHHWRSCLDHIIWMFSDPDYRKKNDSVVQFPVFRKPLDAGARERFEGQIGGITNASVRKTISDLQPHHLGDDALDSHICIVHDMDRFDKHRELTIVHSQASLILASDTPPEIVAVMAAYSEGKTIAGIEKFSVVRALQKHGIILPNVAFAKMGKRENQPVIPSLMQIANEMEKYVAVFMAEL